MPAEEEEAAGRRRIATTWQFYTGSFETPVRIPLEQDILDALKRNDQASWQAVIEYVHGHAERLEDLPD